MHRSLFTDRDPVPPRAAPDALSSWLAFHAYQLAVGVFVQERTVEEVAADDGFLPGAFDPSAPVRWPEVRVDLNPAACRVSLTAPDGTSRSAYCDEVYGPLVGPEGDDELVLARPGRPTAGAGTYLSPSPWPRGDSPPRDFPPGLDRAAIEAALDDGMEDGSARAIVVAHDGGLVAERYAPPFTRASRHAGWSMSKSLVGALVGRLVHDGAMRLDEPAALAAWQGDSDPRGEITIADLLRMSSGLDCPFAATPWAEGGKHFRVYAGIPDVREFAASMPPLAPAGTRCAYQNSDPILAAACVADAAAKIGLSPAEAPRDLLFRPVGMDSIVLGADPSGNFILSGWSTATALDWARFGQFYLDDGVWDGERLLPEGWLEYAAVPAPADEEEVYGSALIWLGERFGNLPPGSLTAAGAFGQRTVIVPSHRLVVVRMGHGPEDEALTESIADVVARIAGAVEAR